MTGDPVEILLVDDHQADVELTQYALREARLVHEIRVAQDGEEALEFLFRRGRFVGEHAWHLPRLILLDLKLPKVDGFEVLLEVKRDPQLQSIPVVVLTSSKQELDIITCFALGANSYVQKPVDFDRFRETVKQVGMYWLHVNEPVPTLAFPAERLR